MGTDIHVFAEVFQDGAWTCPAGTQWNELEQCDELVPIFDDRYHPIFGLLAGVRACIRADPPIEPIALPRGLPKDVSEKIMKEGKL